MLELFDNAFSPFARKVRMALSYKDLDYRSIDGLALSSRSEMLRVNPRGEVPVLVDGDACIVGSAQIVAYLDDIAPAPPLLPPSIGARARARRWHELSDTALDAIVHDASLWQWPTLSRTDSPPAGLVEDAMRDSHHILKVADGQLVLPFLCGSLSIADIALFPHVSALKFLGFQLATLPNVDAWFRRMREVPCVAKDVLYLKGEAATVFSRQNREHYESTRVVWRGDRIEWLLANGYFDWFEREFREGRVIVPHVSS